ncbi:MAG: hypothetical protein F9K30_19875 [Dechloromonas sp.]|nr:MAG: hypothetical protein F9K30_19875 [Dechloromonas sp.]
MFNLTGATLSGERDQLPAVLNLVVGNQSKEAAAMLAAGAVADARERELARAIVAMAAPPLSEQRVTELGKALEVLADGRDDLAAEAHYLRARLFQLHQSEPDWDRASAWYRMLAERQPENHWAQLGLVKLGLILLHAPGPDDATARISAAAALPPRIREAELRRDLHLQIAWAGLAWERPRAEVLRHLLAADEIGGLIGISGEDLVMQIAELSLREGQTAQARRYFERFLREFRTSPRNFNVRQRLAELELLEQGVRTP